MRCNCCHSETLKQLEPHGEYRHFRCESCGFEHFDRGDSDIPAALYEDDADYVDDLRVASSPEDLILWHHSRAARFLQTKFPSGNATTLDLGCFNGFFVKKLLSMGYDAHGVDFNKKAVAFGQENLDLGSRISTRTLEDLIGEGRRFDAVTLFEVLEHLPSPQLVLRDVTKLLKRGGALIVSTPNSRMCWRPPLDFPPHHLNRFTPTALRGCLSQFNLEILTVEEQMSTYELLRHYAGTFFRARTGTSLRGGEFKHKKLTTFLRRTMNKMRKALSLVLLPLDRLLHVLGVRYISQVVIAEKR